MASGVTGWGGAALVAAALAIAGPAAAQVCRGAPPAVGQTVSGPVLHVIDGATLCIARGPTPDQWIPLRVASSVTPLPADRERLMASAFSRSLVCEVKRGRSPTPLAACTVAGAPLSDLLSQPATLSQAKTWR